MLVRLNVHNVDIPPVVLDDVAEHHLGLSLHQAVADTLPGRRIGKAGQISVKLDRLDSFQ